MRAYWLEADEAPVQSGSKPNTSADRQAAAGHGNRLTDRQIGRVIKKIQNKSYRDEDSSNKVRLR